MPSRSTVDEVGRGGVEDDDLDGKTELSPQLVGDPVRRAAQG